MTQQPVELILTRQWMSYIGVPALLVDGAAAVVAYNDAAATLLGRTFGESGDIAPAMLPSILALAEAFCRQASIDQPQSQASPMQRRLLSDLNGVKRIMSATVLPLHAIDGRYIGAAILFWEDGP